MKDINFEQSFERLEKILEKLNEGKVSLEESLKLFEEANGLIKNCDHFLNTAQQKVDILLKERDGTSLINENKEPQTAPFIPSETRVLNDSDIPL